MNYRSSIPYTLAAYPLVDRAHGGSESDPTGRILDYVSHAFEAAGVRDYCLGLNMGGERIFVAAGRRCSEHDAKILPSTGFELSCLFKPLMAAAALELHERGDLNLDAPIGRYLPELAGHAKGQMILVRHLLSHSAGYMGFTVMPAVYSFPNRASGLTRIRKSSQLFWPGYVFNYEHSVTAVLGEILQVVSGQNAVELVNSRILAPLGVQAVIEPPTRGTGTPTFESAGNDAAAVSRVSLGTLGATFSTVDLLSVTEMFMGDERSSSAQTAYVSASMLDALRTPVVTIPRTPGSSAANLMAVASGQGLTLFRDGFVGYDGHTSSQAVAIRFHPAQRIAVALGVHGPGSAAQTIRRRVMGGVLELLTEAAGSQQVGAQEDDSSSLGISEIVGDYVGDHTLTVFVRVHRNRIALIGRMRFSKGFELPGGVDDDGRPVFGTGHAGIEPTFFRDRRTGEPCLMLGMCALKKRPVVIMG